MGNSNSNKEGKTKASTSHPQQKLRRLDGVKHVILVHHSPSKEQVKQVRYFRDVLIQCAQGNIKIDKMFNLAEATLDLYDVTWLDDLHNVVVIRLTPEGISTIKDVARRNKYVDENNILHGRVISVAFGNSIPSGWPPLGTQRDVQDLRDFCLGQEKEEDGFDDTKLKSLVSAIMASN